MRIVRIFGSALVFLFACGTSYTGPNGNNPDSGSGSGNPDASTLGTPAFDVTTGDIQLAPGQQVVYCWYFKTPNTTQIAVNHWVADMTPGSHHMIMFVGGAAHADGLETSGNCGFGSSGANWTYAAAIPHAELALPSDDGSGKPLAQVIPPGAQGVFQMHYINSGDTTLMAHVHVQGYSLAPNTPFTQTDPYVTYNQDLNIPPHANALASPPTSGSIWTSTCSVPAGVKFWEGTTHSHKQSVEVDVLDGSSMIYKTDNWDHPEQTLWNSSPFFTFASGKVTTICKYVNDGDNANSYITPGNDSAHAEMCMMTSYYFPGTGAKFNAQYGGTCYSL